MNHFVLHHVDGQGHVGLLVEQMAMRCTKGRRQLSVKIWAMFFWKSLGPGIHMDASLTHTTYCTYSTHCYRPSTPLDSKVSPKGSFFFYQANAPCHKSYSINNS